MSKYKSPIGGSGKRTSNLFYRSGISSLLTRIEKVEHQVFCCGDDGQKETHYAHTGTKTLTVKDSGKTFILDVAASAEIINLPEITADNLGMEFKFVVVTANTAGYTIQTADGDDTTGDIYVGGLNYNGTGQANGFIVAVDNDGKIVLDSDQADGGGNAGTHIKVQAVNYSSAAHSHWLVSGTVITADADGTGAATFIDR